MAARLRTDIPALIIASASARSLADAAAQAGYRPLCADFFHDADLRELLRRCGGRYLARMTSFADLPRICAHVERDVPVLCGGGIENAPDVLEALATQREVLNTSAASLRVVRDTPALFADLHDSQIRTAESSADVGPVADGETWLWKPRRGCGGWGILRKAPDRCARSGRNYYRQRLVSGLPVSALWVAGRDGSSQLLGAALQCTGWRCLNADGFQYSGTAGRIALTEPLSLQLQQVGKAIVAASGLVGAFGADFILNRGLLSLLEVNPRLTATHPIYSPRSAAALSPLQQHLAAFGHTLPVEGTGRNADVTAPLAEFVLYAACDVTIGEEWVPEDCWWINRPQQGSEPDIVRVADVPAAGQIIRANQPLCSLLFSAAATADELQADAVTNWPPAVRQHLNLQALQRMRIRIGQTYGVEQHPAAQS